MSELQLLPLGGMGTVTQNMFVYEYENELLLVDCGIGFPDMQMPGVDILIPDVAYILTKLEEGKRIVGMILTHGHDDHIAALPYLLPHLPHFPIYGSPLTVGFARQRVSEITLEPEFHVVAEREEFRIGSHFSARGYRITHSVPDTRHYAIKTPAGLIYHGSDFKLDEHPVDGLTSDLEHIGQLKQEGVLLMMLDCLRVEYDRPVKSETTVGPVISRLMKETKGKFVVTLMSSHIHRIQQVIEAAAEEGRRVAFIGRSVEQNVRIAQELGQLQYSPSMVVDKRDLDQVPDSKACLIVAGSQGQEGSSLVRAIFGEHPVFQIKPTDTVVFSADAIPGNELAYFAAIDQLASNGVHVLYPDVEADLHESGHASRVEQKQMVDLVRPEFVMPIGGADRHRFKFKEFVAEPAGYDAKHTLLPVSGEILGISASGIRVVDKITLKPPVVDGLGVGDVGPAVLSDRRNLSQAGMVVVVIPKIQGKLAVEKTEVISRGFVFMKEAEEVIDFIRDVVRETVQQNQKTNEGDLKRAIEKRLARKLYKIIRREPLILPVILPIS